MKNCFGGSFDYFLGKKAKINIIFLSQIRYWIFYYLTVFPKKKKKKSIFGENGEKLFLWAKSLFKGRGRLMTKMNITFIMGNDVSNSSSYNNFFEDSIILWENKGHLFFLEGGRVGGGIDLGIFYVKTVDNTIKTIDSFRLSPNSRRNSS